MGTEHVLAIDLGTGGPKAALVTPEGRITAHEFEPTPLELLGDGGAEQDPDGWWEAITIAVRRLLDGGHVAPEDVVAVAVTSQWSGTVAVDAGGRHLHPAVIWMDSRGAPYVEELVTGRVNVAGYDAFRLKAWIQKTGGIPSHSGKDPIGHILWLRHHEPEVYRATATFLEPCDYLNARLTGRICASFDSITAHWMTDNRDLTDVRYDPQLLAWCGLTESQLPELVPSASVVGTVLPAVAEEWGLTPATKVVTATGDVHSAVVGSGALGDYEGHLYMGTSSWLSCHLPTKRTDLLNNQAALPSAVPGRYFLANEHEVGGGALLWLRDQAEMIRDVDEANELAEAVPPGSGRVIFTPWLNGERTPVDDHTIRGGWNNVSLTTTRSELVRSVFEGVAYNSRWLLDTVERFIKRPLDGLNFIGGGARSDLWCQMHADVCDRVIRRVTEPQHANTRGAAFVAWLALGRQSLEELNRAVTIEREFHPSAEGRAAYAPLYKEFTKLYKAHKLIHARLNG
ncbi:MAG: putative xylulokinase [Ilumatobacteraceae bacterium]|nr:putative xylulokinase [Ilumatobacteraceae bacterium]